MSNKKEKKYSLKEHKKKKKSSKKKEKKKNKEFKENGKIEKKLTSDQILESLLNDVKNSAKEQGNLNFDTKKKSKKSKKKNLKRRNRSSSSKSTRTWSQSRSCSRTPTRQKKKSSKKPLKSKSSSNKRSWSRSKSRRSRSRSRSRNYSDCKTYSKSPNYSKKRVYSHSRSSRSKSRSISKSRSRSRSKSYDRFRSSPSRFRTSPIKYKKYMFNSFRNRTDKGRFIPFRRYKPHMHSKFSERDFTNADGQIDKEKLLEIATKNATKLAMEGKLPKGVELVNSMKNKTIIELVSICKQLHEEENLMEKVSSSDEEDRYDKRYEKWKKSKMEKEDDEFIPRPVRPSNEIKINILNANSLPTNIAKKNITEESSLRLAFPVSSGAQHRDKIESTSVLNNSSLKLGLGALTIALSKVKTNISVPYQSTTNNDNIFSAIEDLSAQFNTNIEKKLIFPPPPEPPKVETMMAEEINIGYQRPILAPLPPPPEPPVLESFDSSNLTDTTYKVDNDQNLFPKLENLINNFPNSFDYLSNSDCSNFMSKLKNNNCFVFSSNSAIKTTKSVQEMMTERLKFNSRLNDNSNDFEARKEISRIDEEISAWAQNNNESGKFVGSTGAKVLTAHELAPKHPKYNAWVKKDMFKKAPEVKSGVGMRLLQKMGWQPGEGLGKNRVGPIEPLLLELKADRKGLQSVEDRRISKRESVVDSKGKNPVSVVMEYCSKNRISNPEFTCTEVVHSGTKRFLWKAVLDGVEYQPSLPSSNKKAGKSQVCLVILEALGLSSV